MIINIGCHEFTEVWDGVLYKKLSDYPRICDWELRNIIEFFEYEKNHGRNCEVVCEDTGILNLVQEAIGNRDKYIGAQKPDKITECIHDGVLPMKVKDEVILEDWIYKIVIPLEEKERMQIHIPDHLKEKVLYVENDCYDIWDWSEKVYSLVRT